MKRILIFLYCMLFVGFSNYQLVKAQEVEQYSSVLFAVKEDNNGIMHITADSSTKKKGWFTSYIYEDELKNISDDSGYFVKLKNKSDGTVNVIPAIRNQNGDIVLPDEEQSYIQEKNGQRYVVLFHNRGVLLSEGDFCKVYFPFQCFEVNPDPDHKWQRGFLVSIAEGIHCEVQISQMEWKTKKEYGKYDKGLGACVKGLDAVQIAVQGESIANYQVEGTKDKSYQFKINHKKEGIQILENGRLMVTNEAKSGMVEVQAVNDEGLIVNRTIRIYKSWVVLNDLPIKIPEVLNQPVGIPDWVASVSVYIYKIRLVVTCIFNIMIVNYWYGRRKWKKQNTKKGGLQ